MCKEFCGDREFLWRSVGLGNVVSGGETMSDKIDLENNKLVPLSGPTATSTKVTAEMIVGSTEINDETGDVKVNYFVKFSTENSNHHILYPWEGLKSLVQSWVLIEKEMEKGGT